MKKQINEIKRMQLIAGLITESEYRQSLNEAETPSDIEEFLDGMINDSIPEDSEEGEEVKGVWEADEYADEESYGEAAQEFKNTHKYIMDHGGKITVEGNPDVTYKALPNGDIAYRLIVTLNEATLINKGQSMGVEKPIAVGDLVAWNLIDNSGDRGMGGTYAGTAIGEVTKILGSKNVAAKVISPSEDAGNIYKVNKQELKRVPQKGENIIATVSYNMGAGSGSQGKNPIQGVVVDVNMEKASIKIKTEDGKSTSVKIRDLNNIKVIS